MHIISLSHASPYEGWASRQNLSYAFSKFTNCAHIWTYRGKGAPIKKGPRIAKPSPSLLYYGVPSWLPNIHWRPKLNKSLTVIRKYLIKKTVDKQRWPRPRILYIWDIAFLDYVGYMNEDLVVYHIYDNQEGFFSKKNKYMVRNAEDRLISLADIVITAQRALASAYCKDRSTIYCPPGVSTEFINSLKKAQHKPDDLPKRGTIMGYAGGVNEKLDLNCIDFLANYNPTWQIVLIGKNFFKGRLAEKFEHLLKKKNIHYLGPKPWDQLPCYVKWFNVGILPYFPTNVAKWCDTPAKLFEYLAAELPIVEIGLPNPNTVDGLVEVARTPEEFAQKVENSLKEDNSEKRQIRKKIALENTWESRAKYIIDVIQNRLTGPSHGH